MVPTPPDAIIAALGERYTIEGEIGSGGMALVYRAHDHKHDRPVAVKVIREEVATGLGAERFLREIGMAARLQHPHIVPIYDSGGAGRLLYLVMPLVEGQSLRERLDRERKLPLDVVLRLGLEVAEALSFAHSRGIVHRDVKPENILLFRDHALMVDFGIAKALADAEPSQTTQEGMFIGTPSYMAPEQMFGDVPVDERADLYALASVLYEALSGSPPYTGPSTTAILARKATIPAAPPGDTLERLPPHVERALLQALEHDRERRHPSVAAFADALSAPPERAARPLPRHAGSSPLQSVVVLPFVETGSDLGNEYLGDGISEDLIHALSRLPGLRVVGRTSSFAFKGRQGDVRTIGAELGVGAVLTGSVRRAGQRLRITAELTEVVEGFTLWSERYDRELTDVFAVQDEISRAIVGTLRVRLLGGEGDRVVPTPTIDFGAYEAYLKGLFEWGQRTEAAMRRGVELLRQASEADPAFVLAHAGLANAYITLAIYGAEAPDAVMPLALAAAERALRIEPRSAEALTARASVRALHQFDWTGAESDYLAALDEREQYPVTHQWYAMHLLVPRGRIAEARQRVARARELDPLSPSIAASAGILRLHDGDPAQAERELDGVIAQHPDFALAHYFLGQALSAAGRHGEAVAALERALVLSGESAETRAALAGAHAAAGDVALARAGLAELDLLRGKGYLSPVLPAQVHAALGEADRALDLLEQALAVRSTDLVHLTVRAAFDPLRDHPRFASILRAVGSARRRSSWSGAPR